MPKSVYLAGPEVFLPNAREILDLEAALTREAGLIPVSPGDLEFPRTNSKWELGLAISAIDEKLMHQADAIIANLTPFRGASADAGTAFEVGFMRALGRPVLGYTNTPLDYVPRAKAVRSVQRLAFDADAPDVAIEDFDLSENLMIEIAIEASGSCLIRHAAPPGQEMADLTAFRQCLAQARRVLRLA